MIEFRIDRHSGMPPYLQIVAQVKQAMRMGLLGPGDQLPTAREVVEATTVNPNTVQKAYRELEHEGLVEGRRGTGTFVTASLATDEAKSGAPLRDDLERWMGRAAAEGVMVDVVDAIYTDVRTTYYRT
ncbi:GntR family transcriptional regulator [Actinoplanes sp. M2I2]|uniref:GntR family transcriptional regulator n=1 Tax=Actinoplanes sp. M2I2 TaxID=1734444 RepID=UPI00202067E1|nr:GntR family transcriptional regulator [Actinoplanes sp. M2I2]